jgi:hypothetical protein
MGEKVYWPYLISQTPSTAGRVVSGPLMNSDGLGTRIRLKKTYLSGMDNLEVHTYHTVLMLVIQFCLNILRFSEAGSLPMMAQLSNATCLILDTNAIVQYIRMVENNSNIPLQPLFLRGTGLATLCKEVFYSPTKRE